MRLEEQPKLPVDPRDLNFVLERVLKASANKVNQLADGRIGAVDNALIAAPAAGQFQRGDFVRNSTPSELGTAGSKYVIFGWVNVAAGEPGTFLQCRFLTGN